MNNELQTTSKKQRFGEVFRKISLVTLLAAVVVLEIWYRTQSSPSELLTEIYSSASRFLGALVALVFMVEFSLSSVLHPLGNKSLKKLVFVIPALVIAVNNFPWVSFLAGDCTLDADIGEIVFYAFICLCVGLFEELAFRGCALMLLLKKRTATKLSIFMAIFWSSVLFGAVHLVNVFVSSPGAVLLQIGYSALIGGLCCLVLLETSNIWLCVFIHALYNFAGGVVPRLGAGIIWTGPEIALTAIIGVLVAAYSVYRFFFTLPLDSAEKLFKGKGK